MKKTENSFKFGCVWTHRPVIYVCFAKILLAVQTNMEKFKDLIK